MGLTSVLGSAMSGLRATQDSLGIVSGNISNAHTPGYIRRASDLVEQYGGDQSGGVRNQGVQRLLDAIRQRELRNETGGAGYTGVKSDYASQLEALYGKPGSGNSLGAIFDAFTNSLQSLANDPSSAARAGVLGAAGGLATRLAGISKGIQSLRTDAESDISRSVTRVNELLKGINDINQRLTGQSASDPALLDQRDKQIDELSLYMDIRVSDAGSGAVSITTQSGARLVDSAGAAALRFDARGSLGPSNLNNASMALRGVGSLTSVDANGQVTDLSGDGSIRSGKIAAFFDVRDNLLTQAQAELDELAANLSSALSDKTVVGQAATNGAASGFKLDLSALQKGNTVTLDYVEGGVAKRVSFVRVDDPSQLPLSNQATADPNDRVVGINFSAGMASVAAQMQAALGSGVNVSNPSGGTIQILDDGAGGVTDITGLSAKVTTSALASGDPELALFVDSKTGQPFTGSLDGGPQKIGLAQRLLVNPAVTQNPSNLVIYGPSTLAGDATRPKLLLDRLTKTTFAFDAGATTGLAGQGFTGTIGDYTRQVIANSASASSSAQRLDEGQQVALSAAQSRFAAISGVSVDQEMGNLVQLQNAYAANARVVSAVKDMMDLLLRM